MAPTLSVDSVDRQGDPLDERLIATLIEAEVLPERFRRARLVECRCGTAAVYLLGGPGEGALLCASCELDDLQSATFWAAAPSGEPPGRG